MTASIIIVVSVIANIILRCLFVMYIRWRRKILGRV